MSVDPRPRTAPPPPPKTHNPVEGPVGRDRPASLMEIRLRSGGTFLDNATTLQGRWRGWRDLGW